MIEWVDARIFLSKWCGNVCVSVVCRRDVCSGMYVRTCAHNFVICKSVREGSCAHACVGTLLGCTWGGFLYAEGVYVKKCKACVRGGYYICVIYMCTM